MKRQSGMTLIEIMISVAILAVMAFFSGRIILQALQSKEKANTHFGKQSLLRDTLRVIERDLNTAFNYRDYHTAIYNAAAKEFEAYKKKKKAGPATPPAPSNPNSPPPDDPPADDPENETYKQLTPKPVLTHFVGKDNSLHFTALNYSRNNDAELAGDQAEVGYFTGSCLDPIENETSNCLFRRTTPYIDDDVTEGGEPVVLVTNVKKFSVKYFAANSTDSLKEWDTTGKGKEDQKNTFPFSVEVELILEDPKAKKEMSMTMLAQLRFPNNSPPANSTNDKKATVNEATSVGTAQDVDGDGVANQEDRDDGEGDDLEEPEEGGEP